ncbi:MAG: helix-turn-helix transcriptional regulator [Vicinamibacteria bacterium]
MSTTMAVPASPASGSGSASSVGRMLRQWRTERRISQLDLALQAEVSTRHLSFVETGRAKPSRQMVLLLSSALEVPLRERNTLLLAAGYAPAYRETALEDPEMADVRLALQMILRQHDPFGAVVVNRHWDVVMASDSWRRMMAALGAAQCPSAPLEVVPAPRPNIIRALLAPGPLRQSIRNWDQLARAIVARARRDAARDPVAEQFLRTAVDDAGRPELWDDADLVSPQSLLIPVELEVGGVVLRLLSTISTLGTAQDITLQELHIESFHPADAETDARVRSFFG